MEEDLKPLVKRFYKKLSIPASESLLHKTALNIDALIFNIVSLICTITLLKGQPEIGKDAVEHAAKYVSATCHMKPKAAKATAGGSPVGIPLDDTNAGYSAHTGGVVDISRVDFDGGIARSALDISGFQAPSMSGGGAAAIKVPEEFITKVVGHFKLTAKKGVKKDIQALILSHLECLQTLIVDKHKSTSPFSEEKLAKIIEKKSFAVFR